MNKTMKMLPLSICLCACALRTTATVGVDGSLDSEGRHEVDVRLEDDAPDRDSSTVDQLRLDRERMDRRDSSLSDSYSMIDIVMSDGTNGHDADDLDSADVAGDAVWQDRLPVTPNQAAELRRFVGGIIRTHGGDIYLWSPRGSSQSHWSPVHASELPLMRTLAVEHGWSLCDGVSTANQMWRLPFVCSSSSHGSLLDPRSDVLQTQSGCALIRDGRVVCRSGVEPGWQVMWDAGVRELAGNVSIYHHPCVLMNDGGVECDVSAERRQVVAATLGLPRSFTRSPRRLEGLELVRKIRMGNLHSCAIHEDGRLSCFGLQYRGNFDRYPLDLMHCTSIFGESDTLPERYGRELQCTRGPVLIRGFERTLDVSVNDVGGTCAVKEDGSVWCWGGEVLWDTHPAYESVLGGVRDPGRVEGLPPAIAVSISDEGSGGIIARDGSVWTWGPGCGDGTTRRCIPPVRIW